MKGRTEISGKSRWVALGAALFGLAVTAPASDYPPPPGPYQSGPFERPQAAAGGADRPVPHGSSRMLPLPELTGGPGSATSTAERLFGAAQPGLPDTPPPEPRFAPLPEQATPAGAPHPQDPAAQPPAYADVHIPQAAPGRPSGLPGAPTYRVHPQYREPPHGYPAGMQPPAYGAFPGGYGAGYPPMGFAAGGYPGGPPQPALNPALESPPPDPAPDSYGPAGYPQGPLLPQVPAAADGPGHPGTAQAPRFQPNPDLEPPPSPLQAPADDARFRPPATWPYP